MTVYVDPLVDWGAIARSRRLRHTVWCHLLADTEPELHAFARKLGLRRSWYQHPHDYRWHYDITPTKRTHALHLGAVELTRAEAAHLLATRRSQGATPAATTSVTPQQPNTTLPAES